MNSGGERTGVGDETPGAPKARTLAPRKCDILKVERRSLARPRCSLSIAQSKFLEICSFFQFQRIISNLGPFRLAQISKLHRHGGRCGQFVGDATFSSLNRIEGE